MLLFIVVKVARLRHVHVHNMENVYGANTGEYFYRWGEGWSQGFGTKRKRWICWKMGGGLWLLRLVYPSRVEGAYEMPGPLCSPTPTLKTVEPTKQLSWCIANQL